MDEQAEKKKKTIKEKLLDRNERSKTVLRCTYFLMGMTSGLMTIVNIMTHEHTLAIYTFAFSIMCIIDLIMAFGGEILTRASKVLFEAEGCGLGLYFLITGNPDGFSAIWLLFIPGCAFLVLERRNAFVLGIAVQCLLCILFYTSYGRSFLQYEYTDTFMLRFPILYAAFMGVSFFLSYSIKIFQDKLYEIQTSLENEVRIRTDELVSKEREMETMRTEAVVSQIQPHFLYNTISAIAAIPGNSEKCINALVDFGKYMRGNFNAYTSSAPIPIREELEHVEKYIKLTRLRFGDKISCELDIQDDDFRITPLSVQMIVQSAIKYGLEPKKGKGTVKIKTEFSKGKHVVTITDDGVGCDMSSIGENDDLPFGLKNVLNIIHKTCNGLITIDSQIGQGAVVRMYIDDQEGK